MNSEKLILWLLPADTDPPLRSSEYQQGLSEVGAAFSAQGIKVSHLVDLEEADASQTTHLLGYTIELAKVAAPVLAGIVGAWLQERYGRKTRLKIGDIEAEARTPEEVEKLISIGIGWRRMKGDIMVDKSEEGINVHVPPMAGSGHVGEIEKPIDIPENERCTSCKGTGLAASTSTLTFPICPACRGTGRR